MPLANSFEPWQIQHAETEVMIEFSNMYFKFCLSLCVEFNEFENDELDIMVLIHLFIYSLWNFEIPKNFVCT